MAAHRHVDAICICVTLLTLLVTLLFMHGEKFGLQPYVDPDAEEYVGTEHFTVNDQRGDWNSKSATRIELLGDHARVRGGGAYAVDGNVFINSAGRYVLTGTLENGSITVDTNKKAKVWILLAGADIRCDHDACIRVEQVAKLFLTLEEGTENRLYCAGISELALAEGVDGAIFSRDNLTINGGGCLTVSADQEHGIAGNDLLKFTGGEISVSAPGDALHVSDGVYLMNAALRLAAGDDGISVNEKDGGFYMESGSLQIEAEDKGIRVNGKAELLGGEVEILAGGDRIEEFAVSYSA